MDNKAFDTDTAGEEQAIKDVSVTVENGSTKKNPFDAGFTNVVDDTEQPKEPATKPYAGMGKEDLLRFSDTPFWNRFRMACLVSTDHNGRHHETSSIDIE